MKKFILFLIGLLFLTASTSAQVTIGSGIEPNSGALLDLKETSDLGVNSTKGLGMPRVLLNTANDLAPAIVGATTAQKEELIGLTVYHIGNVNLCAGFYIWDSQDWLRLPGPCQIAMQCATVKLNGIYRVGTALSSANGNTITLNIDVPAVSTGGTYHIYTDTQNGISFSGTGTLAAGIMNISLAGTGTPKSGGIASTFTIKADYSNNTISTNTCTATIPSDMIPLGKATILGFGYYGDTNVFGYFLNSSASSAMVKSVNNFGTTPTSTVKVDKLTINTINAIDELTSANFLTATNGLNSKPDIIINGYHSNITETTPSPVTDALVKYIKDDGGVAILFDEYATSTNNITVHILKRLFPTATISAIGESPSGAAPLILATVPANDDILDGPFSVNNWTDKTKIDLRGKRWGNDYSQAIGITGIPADEVIVYSRGTNGGATMFRLKNYNVFFVGDGGFLSNNNSYIGNGYSDIYACPFAVDATARPIPRINFGTGTAGTEAATVYNSQLFGNVMAWALKNAKSNK